MYIYTIHSACSVVTLVKTVLKEPPRFHIKDTWNSYFYIEKWTFKIKCEVCYRAKRDKKEAT